MILCSPPAEPPDITVVMGVNDDQLRARAPDRLQRLVHRARRRRRCSRSSTTPSASSARFLTTVHAYTNQQRLADVPAEDLRRGRAAAENIIPQETHAAELLVDLLPRARGASSPASR